MLNKCALSAGVSKSTVTNNTVDPVSIEVDGAGLEDDQNENNTGKCYPNESYKPSWEPKELVNIKIHVYTQSLLIVFRN